MINLFDTYQEQEQTLDYSLKQAGYLQPTIVLEDLGFLPVTTSSPIGFFTGMDQHKQAAQKKGRFFNDISLPNTWEIRADNNEAHIFEGYKKKGTIVYSTRSGDYRIIAAIEWFNDEERLRARDLYNQNGLRFARQSYSDGTLALTTYFDEFQREVILMNQVTNTIQVNYQKKQYCFKSFESFVLFYFDIANLETQRILYSSLGRPFFITRALSKRFPENDFHHTLFWQEESTEMPGNMALIFEEGLKSATHQIVAQVPSEYARLAQQIPQGSPIKLNSLGYLYHFKATPPVTPTALILTASDQVAHLEVLIERLPQLNFHIAAQTEMSQTLTRLSRFSNVQLFPNVTDEELKQLRLSTTLYLDINFGPEVDHSLFKAFSHNQLILTFKQTAHHLRFVAPMLCFETQELEALIETIERLITQPEALKEALKKQHSHAGQTTPKTYQEVIG